MIARADESAVDKVTGPNGPWVWVPAGGRGAVAGLTVPSGDWYWNPNPLYHWPFGSMLPHVPSGLNPGAGGAGRRAVRLLTLPVGDWYWNPPPSYQCPFGSGVPVVRFSGVVNVTATPSVL